MAPGGMRREDGIKRSTTCGRSPGDGGGRGKSFIHDTGCVTQTGAGAM